MSRKEGCEYLSKRWSCHGSIVEASVLTRPWVTTRQTSQKRTAFGILVPERNRQEDDNSKFILLNNCSRYERRNYPTWARIQNGWNLIHALSRPSDICQKTWRIIIYKFVWHVLNQWLDKAFFIELLIPGNVREWFAIWQLAGLEIQFGNRWFWK